MTRPPPRRARGAASPSNSPASARRSTRVVVRVVVRRVPWTGACYSTRALVAERRGIEHLPNHPSDTRCSGPFCCPRPRPAFNSSIAGYGTGSPSQLWHHHSSSPSSLRRSLGICCPRADSGQDAQRRSAAGLPRRGPGTVAYAAARPGAARRCGAGRRRRSSVAAGARRLDVRPKYVRTQHPHAAPGAAGEGHRRGRSSRRTRSSTGSVAAPRTDGRAGTSTSSS